MRIIAAIIIAASMFLGACGGTEIRYVGTGNPMTDEEQFDLNLDLQTCYSIRNAQC